MIFFFNYIKYYLKIILITININHLIFSKKNSNMLISPIILVPNKSNNNELLLTIIAKIKTFSCSNSI